MNNTDQTSDSSDNETFQTPSTPVVYISEGIANNRHILDNQLLVGTPNDYWFLKPGKVVKRYSVKDGVTKVSAATARDRIAYHKFTRMANRNGIKPRVAEPSPAVDQLRQTWAKQEEEGRWPLPKVDHPFNSLEKKDGGRTGLGYIQGQAYGRNPVRSVILAILIAALVANMFVRANAVLVKQPCRDADVTRPMNGNYKFVTMCHLVNCTVTSSLRDFRDAWMSRTTPTPWGTFGNISKERQAEWIAEIMGLGGLHKCSYTLGPVSPNPKKIVTQTWDEYFWNTTANFTDRVRGFMASDEATPPGYVPTPSRLVTYGIEAFRWMFSVGVFGFVAWVYQAYLAYTQAPQALPWWKLLAGFPSIIAKREGFFVFTASHYMTTFLGYVCGPAYVLASGGPEGMGYALLLVTVTMVASVLHFVIIPQYALQDNVYVPRPLSGQFAAVMAESAAVYGMVLGSSIVQNSPTMAVGIAIIVCMGVSLIAPPSATEQVIYIQDGNKRRRVTVYPKERSRCGPFYNYQAKQAGARVTPQMFNNTRICLDTGNGSQCFMHCAKIYVIGHGWVGAPVVKGHPGEAETTGLKGQPSTVVLNCDQNLKVYNAPAGLAGKSSPRGCAEDGWHTVIVAGDKGPNAYTFWGTWNGTQLTGLTHNEPGMSGAAVYDGAGRIVAVHVGGTGQLGVMLRFPEDVASPPPPVKDVNKEIDLTPAPQSVPLLEKGSSMNRSVLELEMLQAITSLTGRFEALVKEFETTRAEITEQRQVFSEEEYHKLQNKGLGKAALRELAKQRITGKYEVDSSATSSSGEYHGRRMEDFEGETFGYHSDRSDYEDQKRSDKKGRKPRGQKDLGRGLGYEDHAISDIVSAILGKLRGEKVEEPKKPEVRPVAKACTSERRLKDVHMRKRVNGKGKNGGARCYDRDCNMLHLDCGLTRAACVKQGRTASPCNGRHLARTIDEATLENDIYVNQCVTNDYDDQRTRGCPVIMACGAKTTSPTGHIRYAAGACACGPQDYTVHNCPGMEDHTKCKHYWCGQLAIQNDGACKDKNCKNDFCRLPFEGERRQIA